MLRREDIIGIIFCNKPKKLIPNFGRSQIITANKIKAPIINKMVFLFLRLLRSGSSILSIVCLVLLLSFILKNGRNSHNTNKIRIIKRIRRTIKIFSVVQLLKILSLTYCFLKIYSTSSQQSVGKIHNNSKSSFPVFFNPCSKF